MMPKTALVRIQKEAAKHGDDYLIFGEFPNLGDKNIER